MDKGLAVSVLDLVGTRAGERAGSAIARSVNLAQRVEQMGYKRYWLAEHHSISGLACSAAPVMIGHVAAATKTIRVGSVAVMLANSTPRARGVWAKRRAAESGPDGRGAGDCGRDGCGSLTVVHDATATFFAVDSKSTSRVIAPS